VFAVMLGLAALNRFHLTPAVLTDPERALPRLRRSLGLEAALGAVVLALVAVIGTLVPPAAL
jgi:putative copper resistance protein D